MSFLDSLIKRVKAARKARKHGSKKGDLAARWMTAPMSRKIAMAKLAEVKDQTHSYVGVLRENLYKTLPSKAKKDEQGRVPINFSWPKYYDLAWDESPGMVDRLNTAVIAWLEERQVTSGLGFTAEKAVERLNPGLYVVLWYPGAMEDRCFMLAKMVQVIFLIDDLYTELTEDTVNDPKKWEFLIDLFSFMAPGGPRKGLLKEMLRTRSAREIPVIKAWAEACTWWQATAERSFLEAFHWGFVKYVEGCYLKHCMALGYIPITHKNYFVIRIHDACTLPFLTVNDWMRGYNAHGHDSALRKGAPKGEAYNPEIAYFLNSTGMGPSSLFNDAVSFNKEIGADFNAVDVIKYEKRGRDVTAEEIAAWTENIANGLFRNADQALQRTIACNREDFSDKTAAHRFLLDVRGSMFGVAVWQTAAKRYIESPFVLNHFHIQEEKNGKYMRYLEPLRECVVPTFGGGVVTKTS